MNANESSSVTVSVRDAGGASTGGPVGRVEEASEAATQLEDARGRSVWTGSCDFWLR